MSSRCSVVWEARSTATARAVREPLSEKWAIPPAVKEKRRALLEPEVAAALHGGGRAGGGRRGGPTWMRLCQSCLDVRKRCPIVNPLQCPAMSVKIDAWLLKEYPTNPPDGADVVRFIRERAQQDQDVRAIQVYDDCGEGRAIQAGPKTKDITDTWTRVLTVQKFVEDWVAQRVTNEAQFIEDATEFLQKAGVQDPTAAAKKARQDIATLTAFQAYMAKEGFDSTESFKKMGMHGGIGAIEKFLGAGYADDISNRKVKLDGFDRKNATRMMVLWMENFKT